MSQPRPVGIRIPRPYDTEEEFIRGDGLAIGRLGMILIGAPKRPPGITIRFEVLLRSGDPVFRGEGRVVAHRIHSNGREGLEIRFTRLDSRSKALVEQVLDLRKTGSLTPASMPPPPMARPAPEPKIPASPPPARMEEEQKLAVDQVEQVEQAPRDSDELAPLGSRPASPVGQDVGTQPEATEAQATEAQATEAQATEAQATEAQATEAQATEAQATEAQATEAQGGQSVAAKVQGALGEEQTAVEEPKYPSPIPARVQETEDSAPAEVEEIEELEPEEELEVLDEDPTPFAPPVMLAEIEEGPTDRAPTPPSGTKFTAASVEASEDPAAALSKLRTRQGEFETPPSANDLLERLRQRARAS